MAVTNQQVAELYVATFNRAPDADGLDYWVNLSGLTIEQIAQSFFDQAETQTLYPTGTTDSAFVTSIYTNLFNRAPDAAGLAYWVANLTTGSMTRSVMIEAMKNGALGADAAIISNKAEVALYHAVTLGLQDTTFSVASVTAYQSSVTAAKVSVDNVAAGHSADAGTTFTLTTAANNFTGTANGDTFNAIIDQATPANSTITAADVISGGAGADTLNITGTGTTLDALGSALVTGIETVNIRATTANTLDASQIAGLTAVNANLGTGTVLVSNLATGASIGVIGNGTVVNGEVAFAPATAASAITLNVSGGTAMTAGITAHTALGGGATGTATTATINSTGAANTVGTVDLANATLTSVTINAATNLTGNLLSQATDQVAATGAVTVSGAATLVTFTAALDNSIATINASGMTAGGISATLGTLATQTVTGGAGADTITTGGVLTTGSVNAGTGTDTLVVASAADLASATLGAKYTNFETLRVNDSQDVSVISGITAVELNAMTSKSVTGMNATQAAHVKVLGDQTTGVTLALASSAGTSDSLTMTMGTGLTTSASFDLAGLTVTGFETINLVANPGATATVGANKTVTVASLTGATLNTVNMTGTAFDITNATTTVATTFNASALTGDGTVAGSKGLTIAGSLVAGSTVTGSALIDTVTIGAEGSTYNLGAGNDTVNVAQAVLVADGTTDVVVNGGAGTDTLALSDAAASITDVNFTNVTGMENLTLTGTTSISLTTGGSFKTAFTDGVTITSGTVADNGTVTYAMGLYDKAVTLTTVTSGQGVGADTIAITTGTGADTVTVTAASWVGQAGAAAAATIATGAGADTITFSIGNLLATTSGALTINAGTGADTITVSHTNDTTATALINFTVADGDSLAASRDMITGFLKADGTDRSDVLDFGTANVAANTAGTDGTNSGTIMSHAIASGIITFDDVNTFATALVINSTNLSDTLTYLATNISTAGDTVAFAYDSDNNGTADATIVFNQGALDSVVQLVGVTGATAIGASATTANLIAIG